MSLDLATIHLLALTQKQDLALLKMLRNLARKYPVPNTRNLSYVYTFYSDEYLKFPAPITVPFLELSLQLQAINSKINYANH